MWFIKFIVKIVPYVMSAKLKGLWLLERRKKPSFITQNYTHCCKHLFRMK